MIPAIAMASCATPHYPENVQKTLDIAGENRKELEKTLIHYSQEKDSLKYQATCFLIGNMGSKHSYLTFDLVDSTDAIIPWEVFFFENYSELLDAWDSLENNRGKIHFKRDKHIPDHEVINADYLIKNIDQAFEAWQFPWAKQLSFDQFCEFVLPYRCTNEPLEEWRAYFLKEYAWLKDSMQNSDDPVRACSLINNEIRSWFRFDERFYEHPTDQGLSELLDKKMGRCEDMTNLAVMAMRAWGIPVMSDYTPYWANTGNNHAWNALLDKNGNTLIFMGGEANPLEYKLKNIKAKVLRKTFSKQPESIMEVKQEWEKVPPYLNSATQIDVTKEYGKVADVRVQLKEEKPDSVEFAYLCVFNSGEWKAIHWGKIGDGNGVVFTDMGLGIAYLPAYYKNNKIIPAGPAFILNINGDTEELIAVNNATSAHTFFTTTKRTSGQTTEDIGQGDLENGLVYQLFFWDNKWQLIKEGAVKNNVFVADGIPANALLWLKKKDGREEERIFTLVEGLQVWW
ncbi:MAG: transglutaminase-like domain-containing protein [Bacteroidales bacterium]|nr:transglutaminase-like domain-containing protein [Bacteroidales bacterium]MCF8455039.1 transglutaminase-like domain-containing protein [Bacteroidales bacterium]